MKIDIWVRDLEVAEKNESNSNLGIDSKGENEWSLTSLDFCRNQVTAFWHDNSVDAETGSEDIQFYVGSFYFKTPSSKQKIAMFEDIIEENEKRNE